VRVADPVGGGFVDSLAWPGGNTTGFMLFEYSFSAKWLELLKEIVPHPNRGGRPSRCYQPRRYRRVRGYPIRSTIH